MKQKKIIHQWMGTSRFVYNRALYGIKNKTDSYNWMDLRNKYVTRKNNTICNEWEYETPKDIRCETIRDLCKAYNSTMSNFKLGNIKHFNMNYRCKKDTQTIVILKTAISKKNNKKISIYSTKLGAIRTSKDKVIKNIKFDYDCRLQYKNGIYTINIPINLLGRKSNGSGSCALDPGERKLHTIYSDKSIYKIPFNREEIKKRYETKLRKLQSLRSKCNIRKRIWKRRSNKIYNRIENLVDDIHYGIINELVENYDKIYIPKFESQKLVGINFNKNTRRNLLTLRHYKFKSRLKDKCNLYGIECIECKEEYTSKTCTNCGSLNNVGSSEIYKCNYCNIVLDRDINGSRNILIKNET